MYLSEQGALSGKVNMSVLSTSEFTSDGNIDLGFVHTEGKFYSHGGLHVKGFTSTAGSSISGGMTVDSLAGEKYCPQLNLNSCVQQPLLSPSSNHTYTEAGIYKDTLSGSGGCDSIISIEVMYFDKVTYLSESKCIKYTSPSGDYQWTESGVYSDVMTNINGCDSLIEIDLTIVDCSCELYIPNAFTANNDGVNDVFYGIGVCEYNDFEMIIFNRNGERLFLSDDVNLGWAGMYMGTRAPNGTYLYSISYSTITTDYVKRQGLVNLLD